MRILAVDPGGTTGFALYEAPDVEDLIRTEHYETDAADDPMRAIDFVRREILCGLDALVVEEFKITSATAKKTRGGSNTAIEIIGAVKWIAHKRGVRVVMQTPGDAKEFSADAKLKRLGWWPTNDHERAATRHLVLYLARAGRLSATRLLGLQSEGGEQCQ